jgi:hypothetical protein
MPVAFLTDVRLRFALSLVSPSGLQSHIATHVAAFAEALRIFQRQQVGERDQRSPLSSPAPAALLADNFPWRSAGCIRKSALAERPKKMLLHLWGREVLALDIL